MREHLRLISIDLPLPISVAKHKPILNPRRHLRNIGGDPDGNESFYRTCISLKISSESRRDLFDVLHDDCEDPKIAEDVLRDC